MTENDINTDLMAELDKYKRIANGQAYALKLAVEALARVVILEAKKQQVNEWKWAVANYVKLRKWMTAIFYLQWYLKKVK